MAPAANEASSGRHDHAGQYIESLFLQVANARRKAEAQQTAHGKDMIGEAAGVGVVFVNDKAALVIKQSVEDAQRVVARLVEVSALGNADSRA